MDESIAEILLEKSKEEHNWICRIVSLNSDKHFGPHLNKTWLSYLGMPSIRKCTVLPEKLDQSVLRSEDWWKIKVFFASREDTYQTQHYRISVGWVADS